MKTESVGGDGAKEQKEEGEEEKKGPWTPEEDELLGSYVRCHGEGRWNSLAKSSGLKRTGKSCRLRWLNYLKPGIKRGGLTLEEQLKILDLHTQLGGNKWSKIAANLPGRTDNEIKNYWRTRVQKLARQMNMDSNSPSFADAIRCKYMPILAQKIEQNSANATSYPLNYEGSSTCPFSQNTHLTYSPNILASDINKHTSFSNISLLNTNFPETTLQPTPAAVTASFTHGTTVKNTEGRSPVAGDCYYVDNPNHDDMDLGPMSAMNNAFSDCHVADPDGLWDDMSEDSIWGLDELWQFKK